MAARENNDVAIIRLEQFYPFPATRLRDAIASYSNAAEIVWVQEEPMNMGGWQFVERRIEAVLPDGKALRFIGRPASASPATGSYAIHELEQSKLVAETLNTGSAESTAAVQN